MKKKVRLIAVGLWLALIAGLTLAPASPAGAVSYKIVACNPNGHIQVAWYDAPGSGVKYRMYAHNCLEDYTAVNGDHFINSRTHWHCTRNGASWDGCRVNDTLEVQHYAGGWVSFARTANDMSEPGGGYTCTMDSTDNNLGFFDDSNTRTSFQTNSNPTDLLRGAAVDPDNMRFCLADGTTVVRDVTDSVSGTYQL